MLDRQAVTQVERAEAPAFDYETAFSRNVGWVTREEQQVLRNKRVAIAGMGGVGGVHLTTLARLGVGAFHIADPDSFEVANMNRQAGARMGTVGRGKAEVLEEMARDINPEVSIRRWGAVDLANIDDFLGGVDLYVDGLDFFCLEIRIAVFRRCRELGIPAITAGPMGMGVSYLIFTPEGMSFDDYFGLEGQDPLEQSIRFLTGLVPDPRAMMSYLVEDAFNLEGKAGPSVPMACQLCAGVAGTEALKLLLGRGKVYAAPYYHRYDAYQGESSRGRLFWGHRNPLQAIRRAAIRRKIRAKSKPALPAKASQRSDDDTIAYSMAFAQEAPRS